MNKHRNPALWAVLLVGLMVSAAFADDHVVQEHSMAYMGRMTPPQPAEAWLAADRTCVKDGSSLVITRQDLKKRWLVNLRSKKYLEEDLTAPTKSTVPAEKPFRIQEYGFSYEPVFDWTLDKDMPAETIEGKACRKVTARGEADYAEAVRETWVTDDVPVDAGRVYEALVRPNMDDRWREIYEKTPALKKGFAMKSILTEEDSIAPKMVWTTRVTKVETAAPPAGTYEVPAGMQKVKTIEELYAR